MDSDPVWIGRKERLVLGFGLLLSVHLGLNQAMTVRKNPTRIEQATFLDYEEPNQEDEPM